VPAFGEFQMTAAEEAMPGITGALSADESNWHVLSMSSTSEEEPELEQVCLETDSNWNGKRNITQPWMLNETRPFEH
jgi:hypothetical protein